MKLANKIIRREFDIYSGINDFLEELEKIKNKYINKNYKDSHLIKIAYNTESISNEIEATSYAKANLFLAIRWLKENFIPSIKKHKREERLKDILIYFVLDLKRIINFLNRDGEESFVSGEKSNIDNSFFMFSNVISLFYNGELDFRSSILPAILSFRQALEIRANRSIGLFSIKNKDTQNNIKLHHDFVWNFLSKQQDIVKIKGISLLDIYKIYKWTNFSIHTGIMPPVWLIGMGFIYASQFINSGKNEKCWNINGAIVIKDYEELKRRFEQEVNIKYTKDVNKEFIYYEKPEALVE